jgi:hypothetical protein
MLRRITDRLSWRAVLVGWVVAVVTGIVVNLVFEAAHIFLFGGDALTATNPTAAVVTISLLSGFLAHFAGGYVAGRRAGVDGGLHGAAVAILGTLFLISAVTVVAAIAVATAGILFVEGAIPFPPVTVGLARGALLTGLALLLLNLVGAFFGGTLGQWEVGPARPPGGKGNPSEGA